MPHTPLSLLLLIAITGAPICSGQYEPNWPSLDTRPLPAWYDEAKIGIFIHWGVFSVPSYGMPDDPDVGKLPGGNGATGEWFWARWDANETNNVEFMKQNYPPNFTYQDFAPQFTAEFFDPVQWAKVFQAAGAKYIVLTSKHHEGYTLWPSIYSWNWNAMDVGPKRDLVGDLAAAVRSTTPDVKFGLYHSMFEWFHPMYLEDAANHYETDEFVIKKTLPELYEIVNAYQPEIVWSDGEWKANSSYWKSEEFLSWLFSDSPVKETVVVNDRWGKDARCHHGSFLTCNDRYNPGVLQPQKWENALTFDKESWGYRRNSVMADYLSIEETLAQLISTISCGGNMLINIGPTKEGMLPPIMQERLLQMGSWLDINGEGIYGSKPWAHQNDTLTEGVWYTAKDDAVYAFVLSWPEGDTLHLESIQLPEGPGTSIEMLGYDGGPLIGVESGGVLEVSFPPMSEVSSQWAWTLVFTGAQPT
ncbi:unnamed protein product [Meganyctiphanes norvegica]|uniref:Putative alpha-L-fucosidase n=1 Tax=Meganyctiphanes norvegica TaxID=48144 RepID=A0AAV2PS42_MEGNR